MLFFISLICTRFLSFFCAISASLVASAFYGSTIILHQLFHHTGYACLRAVVIICSYWIYLIFILSSDLACSSDIAFSLMKSFEGMAILLFRYLFDSLSTISFW